MCDGWYAEYGMDLPDTAVFPFMLSFVGVAPAG
jgi:hypothetical protein